MGTTTKGGLALSAILVCTLAFTAGSAAEQSDNPAVPGAKARPVMGLTDGLSSADRKQPALNPDEAEVINEMRRLNRTGMDQVKTGVMTPRPSLALPANTASTEQGTTVSATEPSEIIADRQQPTLKLPELIAEQTDQAPAAKVAETDAGFDVENFNRSQLNLVGLLLGKKTASDDKAADEPGRTRSMGTSRAAGARPVAAVQVDTGAATATVME